MRDNNTRVCDIWQLQVIGGPYIQILVIKILLVGIGFFSEGCWKYSWTRAGDKWSSGSHVFRQFE